MTEPKPQEHQISSGPIEAKPFRMGMDEMNAALDSANPKAVIDAGKAYTAAGRKLAEAAGTLRAQANALESVWKGEDADAAIKQMRRLQRTAENMRNVADKTGNSLSTFGPQLEWYVNNRPGSGFFKNLSFSVDDAGVIAAGTMVAGPTGGLIALGGKKVAEAIGILDNEEDKVAREHMDRLAGRAVEANNKLPRSVTTDLPYSRDESLPPPPPPPPPPSYDRGGYGGGPGGGPGGGTFKPDGNMPDYSSVPGGNHPGGPGGLPGGPGGGPGGGYDPYNPGRSDLAGLPQGGTGGIGAGADPFGRGGLGGVGGGIGGGGGTVGAGLGGGAGIGGATMGGLAGGPPGAGVGAGRGAGGLGSGRGLGAGRGLGGAGRGMGSGGMMGAPMGARGGGAGGGEDEHERTTWLTEDEDVWGGNDGDTAPPVIG